MLHHMKRNLSKSPEDSKNDRKKITMDPPFGRSSMTSRSPIKSTDQGQSTLTGPNVVYNVETHNAFTALNTASTSAATTTNLISKRKNQIPPFTVVGATDFKKAIDIVTHITKSAHTIKYMRVGTKIQVQTQAAYEAVSAELKSKNISFYSHDQINIKPIKFAISGLPFMEIKEIEDDLRSQNLDFLSILAIKPKAQRFNDEYIYFVNFKPNTVNLGLLKKIKAINHTIVTWFKPSNRTRGPTQCKNCFMYGHGMRNCNLPKICIKCGIKDHAADQCNAQSAKCVNCGKNHQADDASCDNRKTFIEMRTKLSAANNKKKKTQTQPEIAVTDASFPLPPKSQRNAVEQSAKWPFSFGKRVTFNNMASPSTGTSVPPRNDLFSTEEIMAITKDVFAGLRMANSKEEQLEVIFCIAANYIYGSKP